MKAATLLSCQAISSALGLLDRDPQALEVIKARHTARQRQRLVAFAAKKALLFKRLQPNFAVAPSGAEARGIIPEVGGC